MILRTRILTLFALTLLVSGCTVVPKPVVPKEPSFDGSVQNSGFLGFTSDGKGIITNNKYNEYDALSAHYGDRFTPPLLAGQGVTKLPDGTWLIDQEHLVAFRMMLYWKLNNR